MRRTYGTFADFHIGSVPNVFSTTNELCYVQFQAVATAHRAAERFYYFLYLTLDSNDGEEGLTTDGERNPTAVLRIACTRII